MGRRARVAGLNLTAWHLRRGSAEVESAGERYRAEPGQWMICRPMERWQGFDDSARILSIHLEIAAPEQGALWSGPGAVVLPEDRALARRAARLTRVAALRGLAGRERHHLAGRPLSLPEALELRESVAGFARRLFERILPAGLRFGPPVIRDERVRASRLALHALPPGGGYSREALAAAGGVSPSQLDRLWRRELGATPRQYWEARRLGEACARLHQPQCAIKALAYELGFSHLSRFSSWFRAHRGESPRAFRRRALAEGMA